MTRPENEKIKDRGSIHLEPGAVHLEPLTGGEVGEIAGVWEAWHPFHPMTEPLLRERLFGPPAPDPELMLAARDGAGRLLGFAIGVFLPDFPQYGGVRWLGVEPRLIGAGVEGQLLEELCRHLAARGAKKARMLATPPFYLRPGVDVRETALIASLLDLGWVHEGTNFNMTVDLAGWSVDKREIFDADGQGYLVRRARPDDRERFAQYMTEEWTANWRQESLQAFNHDPITLYLAMKNGEVAGFAACEVSQCLGGFGPTGVSPSHRGAGLGRRLLWACLHGLKAAGRPACQIGWVGPVSFYYRACGAQLGPVYWMLTREL